MSKAFSGLVMLEPVSEDWVGGNQGWKRVVFQIRRRGVRTATKALWIEIEKDHCDWNKESKGKVV